MKWFINPLTLEEFKKQYKKLVFANHPDRGGSTKDMQEINAEYDKLIEKFKNGFTPSDADTENKFKDIINKLINFENINIEICGTWVWITGNTYTYRKELKELKFRFSNNKKAWYYHDEDYHRHSKKRFTLDEIREMHGSQTVNTPKQQKLA